MLLRNRFAGKRLIAQTAALILSLSFSLLILSACGTEATNSSASYTPVNYLAGDTPNLLPTVVPTPLDNTPANGQTIDVYSSLPLTGSSQNESQPVVNAINMALDDLAGPNHTVAGFKIVYQSLDDATAAAGQWDANQEKINANKATSDPNAMVYIGTINSGAAKISIPILNQAHMVMISPANTYPGLTKSVEGVTAAGEPQSYYPTSPHNYFRLIATDDLQGPADVQFAANNLKAHSAYVIDDGQDYGKGLADAFAQQAPKNNIKIVGRSSITGQEATYQDLANKIKTAEPEMIFFGGIAQQQPGKLLADIRAAGVSVPFMGGDGLTDQTFQRESAVAGEGAYASISGVAVDKLPAKGQSFVQRYDAKYGAGSYSKSGPYTIYGYEAMAVALSAIEQAKQPNRLAILNAVAATKNFNGVLGNWSFDSNGDTTLTTFTIYQVVGDNYQFVTEVKPNTGS